MNYIMVKKNINILKVKNLNLDEIMKKIYFENEIINIITSKNIETDLYDLENMDYNKPYINNYSNNSINKKLSKKKITNKTEINIEIDFKNKLYNISIIFTQLSFKKDTKEQQYTISFELEYDKSCTVDCNYNLCNLIKLFCCPKLCQEKFESEINKYLDEL